MVARIFYEIQGQKKLVKSNTKLISRNLFFRIFSLRVKILFSKNGKKPNCKKFMSN